MLDVLEYMHGQGVTHRDIKPENILITEDLQLKFADFGFSTTKSKLDSYKGTKTYMAPEIRQGKIYDGHKVDLFATGVVLFILV